MMIKKFKTLLFVMAGILSFGLADAQSIYSIKQSKDIDMKLSGTSTLHKWAMDAKKFTGKGEFDFGKRKNLTGLKSMTFALDVMDLKSGEKALDKNAHKALKSDQFEDILYTMKSSSVEPEANGKYLVKTKGDLTIAGVTNLIDMDVYCVLNKDGSISCSGSEKLKMTDYQVKPPTFMMGAMKTGDDITLDFTLVYTK